MQNAQENLRLSSQQLAKVNAELNEYRNRIELNDRETEQFRQKIQKLMSENSTLGEEMRNAQENLRLSTAQANKLNTELTQFRQRYGSLNQESETYKQRIQKLLSENSQLGDEVRLAQENLRLSASQISKLQNEFKSICD